MGAGAGQGNGSPSGVRPGALTDLLRQVAEAPVPDEAEPAPLTPGTVVGRFEIVRELGRGGFGVVYEARDRELGRQVALKVVRAGRAEGDEGRVSREAEAIARLSHPNLITLHDVGRSDGSPYLVFELLRGKTLQERLDDGPMALQEAVHVAVEVARGLAHAHGEGVVHRDLKPSNVFVTNKGHVKILDFGMAHAFGRRRLSGGTPAYMAPEQWTDEPEDERTDVFALGVMLHRMLSGEQPFPEGAGRWSAGPDMAPKLELPGSPGLAELIDRMLEKAPRGRPRDGAAVLAALAPFEEALRSRPADATPPSHARRRRATLRERLSSPGGRRLLGWVAAVGVGALLAVGAAFISKQVGGPGMARSPEAQPSIAVLPFADLSEKQDQGYLADGIAEELLGVLAKVQGLRVPGRTSSFHFKGKQARLEEVGRELQVEHVLEGSVRSSGKRLRINAELVRISSGDRVWTESFEREFTDVFAIQDEIARAVVAALRVKILPGQAPVAKVQRTANQEAYESYLLGKQFARGGSFDSQNRALAALEKSVQLDPSFASAWAALANARVLALDLGIGMPWSEARREALNAANHAVELAPDLPEALAARAGARMTQWDWAGARSDIDRAKQLAPDDPATLGAMAVYAAWTGRNEEFLVLKRRLVALDPLSGMAWNRLALALVWSERFEEADRAFVRAIEVDPRADFAPGNRILLMLRTGRFAEALPLCPKGNEACLAIAHHGLGNTTESRKALRALVAGAHSYQELVVIAQVQAILGEKDGAFESLEKAFAGRPLELSLLLRAPDFRPLRGDPRLAALLRKMNLSPSGEPLPAAAAAADSTPSIAVLPFVDMSEKKDQEYFADGVAEEILNALAGLRGLRVTGRTSSFSFKGSKDDLGAIGRKLGVATVLEGSVRRAGNRARVTAKLVNVADGFTLWTETYDKDLTDVFGVQEQIARAVVGALKLKLAVGEAPSVATHRTRRPEVYDAYLVARRLLKQGPEGWVAAVLAYEKTLALDPGYGPAWAELAEALYWASEMTMGTARAQLRDRALPAAERGVALAPELATAWSTRGFLRTLLRWDFEGGRQDFTRALALSGGDARVLRDYGAAILPPLGRLDEGIAALVRSTELDPLDSIAWFFLTYCYACSGDWERASRAGARALDVDPGNIYASFWLSVVQLVQGRAGEALAVGSKNQHPVFGPATEAMAFHTLGDRRRSDQLIEKLEAGEFADTAPYQLAEVRAWRGEHDQAFAWLERARVKYDSGLVEIRHDPLLRSLRGDPRFAALLKRLNLPPD